MADLEQPYLGHIASILGSFSPQAKHSPDKPALVCEHGSRSYGELRDRSMRLAAALRGMGLANGDRMATLLFNRGETFELYFACAYAGLTLVPVSFRLTASEISSILNDCSAKVVFTEPELANLIEKAKPSLATKPQVVLLDTDSGGRHYEELIGSSNRISAPIHNEIQLILYTSGSTGTPKGVSMRSQSIKWSAFQQISQFRHLDESAVMLINAPMFNTAGINECSIPTFLMGGTVAIMPSRGWSARRLGSYITRWGVTHALIFPSMLRLMLEADEDAPLPLDSMKWLYTGGENCPPALMQQVQQRWPRIHLYYSYGSTESGFATFIEGDDIEAHPGSVGRVAPGHSIRILDDECRDLGPNEVGEVWTAGPAVMQNYWNAPHLDSETIKDGWLKMGDLGRMDEHGWIYIVGRSKDLIISKGQNIYPAEIENVLRHHPAVIDVAVIGVADEEFGESVCACIIPRKESEPDKTEILTFTQEKLASYKKPRHIFFMDCFPIRNSTKVDKNELRRICSELLAAETGGGD